MPEQQPYRPMCRHGVTPHVKVEWIETGGGGPFSHQIPGRTELVYDCPTPGDCTAKAYRYLIDACVEPPETAQ